MREKTGKQKDHLHIKDKGYWIVYSSNQIKSATENIGTFDPNDPDIRYSTHPLDNDYDDQKTADVLLNMPTQDDVSLKEKVMDNWDYFSRKWIDSGNTINTFGKETGDNYLYAYYNNAKSAQTQALYHIEQEQRDINGNAVGKGLLKIFEPILAKK